MACSSLYMIQYVYNTHAYSYKIASIFPNNDKHQIISTFKTTCKARFKDTLTPTVADGRRTKQDVISLRDLQGRSPRPSCSAPSPPSALAHFPLVRLFVGLKMRVAVSITPAEPSPRGPRSAASHSLQSTPLQREDRLCPFFSLLVEDSLSDNDAGTTLVLTPLFLEIYLACVGLFAQQVGDHFTDHPTQPLPPRTLPPVPLHHLSTWLLTRDTQNF